MKIPVKCTVPVEEVTRVKGLGFLRDKLTADCFNGRVITRNGKLTAGQMAAVAEAARRFGSGEIAMTTRMTVEIQRIPYENIAPITEFLAGAGLCFGGTGPKVRPVVACKGTTCQYGLCDTFGIADEIHTRFYEGYRAVRLPHKFKIGVGGCPNNCVKPDLNDLGIVGQRVVRPSSELCRGCKSCAAEKACPIGTLTVCGSTPALGADCNGCGRCVDSCPFGAFAEYTDAFKVYIGGRWGKKCARGRALSRLIYDRGELMDVIEKAILLFREQGLAGERFADTVARIGFEAAEAELFSDAILTRKLDILSK